MVQQFELVINGQTRSTRTDAERPLLDVLREDFQLTGTKFSCGEGSCGACTVLLGGVPVRSCITSVSEVEGESIETIEGLTEGDELHPVQKAFLKHNAMQCGYCIPGHIMTAVALTREGSDASREVVERTMSQHICRCCNYSSVRSAVEEAVRVTRGQ